MKLSLLALLTALIFTSCAGSRIANTSVATGATSPKAIYIRPFSVAYARTNSAPIRKSLFPLSSPAFFRKNWAKSPQQWF